MVTSFIMFTLLLLVAGWTNLYVAYARGRSGRAWLEGLAFSVLAVAQPVPL